MLHKLSIGVFGKAQKYMLFTTLVKTLTLFGCCYALRR